MNTNPQQLKISQLLTVQLLLLYRTPSRSVADVEETLSEAIAPHTP